jgi:hypothetical protein
MAIVCTQVSAVKTLLEMQLHVPDFQRPYKWQTHHVSQLLEDLIEHQNKSRYRLGTVVLHQSADQASKAVVDGQQRLLTLTLLCHLLDAEQLCRPRLLEQRFDNPTTVRNLQHNASVIDARLKSLAQAEREGLLDFLLNRCELICVVLDDLNEAFQFFDSQNARGKELAPYDLLKAFHLREMSHESEAERIECVAKWEVQVRPRDQTPSLRLIMSDVLFRIRRWSVDRSGIGFSRHNIDVFKGISLQSNHYRLAKPLQALDYLVDQYNADPIRQWDRQRMAFPFVADQTLMNGKRFFEFVQHYIELYTELFVHEKLELAPLIQTLARYKGRHRAGDRYVRQLFECTLLFYYDRFGDLELERVAKLCFLWSYRIRLEQQRVVQESIDNAAQAQRGLFRVVQRALHPQEVMAFTQSPVTAVRATNVEDLAAIFQSAGYLEQVR